MTGKDTQDFSVVLVTGMSGAGKTTALKALEDNGFEVIDNLPVALLPSLFSQKNAEKPLAVGIDMRTRDFDAQKIYDMFKELKMSAGLNEQIVFLDCSDEKLLKRFTETRRAHPLAKNKSIAEGITEERSRLELLRTNADFIVDTTRMRAAELARYIEKNVVGAMSRKTVVTVCSFSYRDGVPAQADLVLRPLTGKDAAVADYIRQDKDFGAFFTKITDLLSLLLPRYVEEGKSYLTIAIGCTGGKHRSVFTAESLYAWLLEKKMYTVVLEHHALEHNNKLK